MPALIQRLIAGAGLLVLGPLVLALAAAVRLTSGGPAFHRAVRHHPRGSFTLYKLRTMRVGSAGAGLGITARGDPRVTSIGRALRRWKLDELPQLWNVVRGEMLLVGPRPEDPRYVDLTDPLHARVFAAMPGITSAASVAYRDEERVLARASSALAAARGDTSANTGEIDMAYRSEVLPAKLRLEALYLLSRSVSLDVRILIATVTGAPPPAMDPLRGTRYFSEWGGRAWARLVELGIRELGDLRGKRVLEIGSRSGRLATLLALRGATVVGIDIAEGFEAAAAREAQSHGVGDRVSFRLDDGRLGSLTGDAFDAVVAKSVLVVVPDRSGYLANLRTLVKPGATLVLVENGRGGRPIGLLRRIRRTRWDPRSVDYFDAAAVATVGEHFDLVLVKRSAVPPVYLIVARRPIVAEDRPS